jgi:hypothetical protein
MVEQKHNWARTQDDAIGAAMRELDSDDPAAR